MPLYEYRCIDCGASQERICSFEQRDESPLCSCGQTTHRTVTAPARTASQWGDSFWDGRKDRGLRTTLVSKKHREAVMRQRGLRQVEDGEVERHIKDIQADHEKHERNVATFNKHKAETGDTGIALARTFPAHEALAK